MVQLSTHVFCEKFLTQLELETGRLPNPYYDYPFMVIKNFLPTIICKEITADISKNQDVIKAKIRKKSQVKIDTVINRNIRETNIHQLNKIHKKIYDNNFLKHQKDIENFYNLALTTSTEIQVLEYTQGSFYKAHSDDSSLLLKDDKIIGFRTVAPERKITTVLFTTSHSSITSDDNFKGGELIFNYLYNKEGENIKIKPNAGDMVVFLSNPYFTHEVLEVKDGCRVSLVQWHNAIVN